MKHVKQPHYLPARAYLSNFQSPERPGYVFMYQRSKPAVPIPIDKAAREGNLYVYPTLEDAFTIAENAAQPIIQRINSSPATISLTGQEYADLALFVACQVIRTPAFIADLERKSEEFTRAIQRFIAQNESAFHSVVERVRKDHPGLFKKPVDLERVRQSFISGNYLLEANRAHFVVEAAKLIDPLWEVLLTKIPRALRADEPVFFTSDYPVSKIRDARLPLGPGLGFMQSTVMLPLGSSTTLLLENPVRVSPVDQDSIVHVRVERVRLATAKQLTQITIRHSVNYLFAGFKNGRLERLFSQARVQPKYAAYHPAPGITFIVEQ